MANFLNPFISKAYWRFWMVRLNYRAYYTEKNRHLWDSVNKCRQTATELPLSSVPELAKVAELTVAAVYASRGKTRARTSLRITDFKSLPNETQRNCISLNVNKISTIEKRDWHWLALRTVPWVCPENLRGIGHAVAFVSLLCDVAY